MIQKAIRLGVFIPPFPRNINVLYGKVDLCLHVRHLAEFGFTKTTSLRAKGTDAPIPSCMAGRVVQGTPSKRSATRGCSPRSNRSALGFRPARRRMSQCKAQMTTTAMHKNRVKSGPTGATSLANARPACPVQTAVQRQAARQTDQAAMLAAATLICAIAARHRLATPAAALNAPHEIPNDTSLQMRVPASLKAFLIMKEE